MTAMFQSWNDLTFLHWRIPMAAVAKTVPKPLTVDTFDGTAWIALTCFRIEGLRPPFFPALPWISNFPETNCRTYVTAPDGKPAIWFFSLDCARALAVIAAQMTFGLPYVWSNMSVRIDGRRARYLSRRARACTDIEIEREAPVAPGPREIFLTERYRLYSTLFGRVVYADVEHRPWPLESATIIRCRQNIVHGDDRPLAHFSPGVRARIHVPRFL
ncbi:MAG TPA: DUF2071 domain-containing protein [Candidatus Limnocylindrales bacterium]|nr:DUF2071 domain-containing protein [Candidatus Limnocylindrales bacterium]